MIQAIIVDNEPNNIETLQLLIEEHCPSVSIVGTAATVAEAQKLILHLHPDIVFLDVELDGETGFDLLDLFSSPSFQVIFQTAHEKYALQAIKSSCLEYITKPIHSSDLIQAMNKYERYHKMEASQKRFEILLENIGNGNQALSKIAIPNADGYVFLNVSDIIYCQSDNNYTILYNSKGERIVSTKSLKEFEELLNPELFFRCHKSWLINLNHIQKYSRSDGSRVMMTNGNWIDIAVRKREEFLRLFDRF